jgi:hypothetical protein
MPITGFHKHIPSGLSIPVKPLEFFCLLCHENSFTGYQRKQLQSVFTALAHINTKPHKNSISYASANAGSKLNQSKKLPAGAIHPIVKYTQDRDDYGMKQLKWSNDLETISMALRVDYVRSVVEDCMGDTENFPWKLEVDFEYFGTLDASMRNHYLIGIINSQFSGPICGLGCGCYLAALHKNSVGIDSYKTEFFSTVSKKHMIQVQITIECSSGGC